MNGSNGLEQKSKFRTSHVSNRVEKNEKDQFRISDISVPVLQDGYRWSVSASSGTYNVKGGSVSNSLSAILTFYGISLSPGNAFSEHIKK